MKKNGDEFGNKRSALGLAEVPPEFFGISGNNGPICIWGVLNYFGRPCTDITQILSNCLYSKQHGTFTIGLALGLKRFGLEVQFFSEPDNSLNSIEAEAYERAKKYDVTPKPAISINKFGKMAEKHNLGIVYFIYRNSGFFSPLIGVKESKVYLPLVRNGMLNINVFKAKWDNQKTLSQGIIVSRKL